MTATIQKWGNSLALRIPLAVAKQIHVKEGDPVTLKVIHVFGISPLGFLAGKWHTPRRASEQT